MQYYNRVLRDLSTQIQIKNLDLMVVGPTVSAVRCNNFAIIVYRRWFFAGNWQNNASVTEKSVPITCPIISTPGSGKRRQGCSKPYSGVSKKFSWGGFWLRIIWWSFVFGLRCLWRHNLTSFPRFQTNVLAKFVDIIMHIFYIHSPFFMCHCTEYKLSALQVRL